MSSLLVKLSEQFLSRLALLHQVKSIGLSMLSGRWHVPADHFYDSASNIVLNALFVYVLNRRGTQEFANTFFVYFAHLLNNQVHVSGGACTQRLQHFLKNLSLVFIFHRTFKYVQNYLQVKLSDKKSAISKNLARTYEFIEIIIDVISDFPLSIFSEFSVFV